ncbi:MAG: nucleotide exchange factor GrpE [Verrucomicrobiota bacterium]
MTERTVPKLAKWPFLLGDFSLLGVAFAIVLWKTSSFGPWQIFFCLVATATGAALCVMPFLLQYRAMVRLAESDGLAVTVDRIQNIETVANQISAATGQWQTVHEQSLKTAEAARQVADKMAGEAKVFSEFLQKANDTEKSHLRLEVEKLRRAEGEWLQIIVRLLDHVYALHLAAVRSGQQNVIDQLGQFQNACRDVARRVGLAAYTAKPGEPFNAKLHQTIDPESRPLADAVIGETVAAGYTYQGRLLRPALVNIDTPNSTTAPNEIRQVRDTVGNTTEKS